MDIKDGTPCVYFIQREYLGLIKIGHSIRVANRLKQIKSAAGRRDEAFTLLAAIPGGYDLEQELHTRFAAQRDFRGYGLEWFRPSPELMQCIEDMKTEYAKRSRLKRRAKK